MRFIILLVAVVSAGLIPATLGADNPWHPAQVPMAIVLLIAVLVLAFGPEAQPRYRKKNLRRHNARRGSSSSTDYGRGSDSDTSSSNSSTDYGSGCDSGGCDGGGGGD